MRDEQTPKDICGEATQAVNLQFPLNVPILEEESISNRLTSRYSEVHFCCQRILCIIFGVQGFVLTSQDF